MDDGVRGDGDGVRGDGDGEGSTESCGRCAMTSVVGATGTDRTRRATEPDEAAGSPDPFGGARIELSDRELRVANAPAVALGGVKRRLDRVATRLTYGR